MSRSSLTRKQANMIARQGRVMVKRPAGVLLFRKDGEEFHDLREYMPSSGDPLGWAIAWERVVKMEALGYRWHADGRGMWKKDPDRQTTREIKIKALDPKERAKRKAARAKRTIPESWRRRHENKTSNVAVIRPSASS